VLVHVALIHAAARARDVIFGRPLLERLLLVGQRAGVKRFFIEAPADRWSEVPASLSSFRDRRRSAATCLPSPCGGRRRGG